MLVRDYYKTNIHDFTFALDAMVREAIQDLISSEHWKLENYLDALDKCNFECLCVNDVTIKFTPEHSVVAEIDLTGEDESFPWNFTRPIRMEVSAVFESILQ